MGTSKVWQLLKSRDRAYRVALNRKLFWKGGVAKANSHADRLHFAFVRRYEIMLESVT